MKPPKKKTQPKKPKALGNYDIAIRPIKVTQKQINCEIIELMRFISRKQAERNTERKLWMQYFKGKRFIPVLPLKGRIEK